MRIVPPTLPETPPLKTSPLYFVAELTVLVGPADPRPAIVITPCPVIVTVPAVPSPAPAATIDPACSDVTPPAVIVMLPAWLFGPPATKRLVEVSDPDVFQ